MRAETCSQNSALLSREIKLGDHIRSNPVPESSCFKFAVSNEPSCREYYISVNWGLSTKCISGSYSWPLVDVQQSLWLSKTAAVYLRNIYSQTG